MKTDTLVLGREQAKIKSAAIVVLFVILMAVASRVVIPLPFSPVPVTLQVFMVILSGLILGSKKSAIVQGTFLLMILMGMPLTAYGLAGPAAFVSPTAGYLLAFLPAAYLVGLYSEKLTGFYNKFVAGLLGIIVIYLGGTVWLAVYLQSFARAWQLGVAPFVVIDTVKAFIAVLASAGLKKSSLLD